MIRSPFLSLILLSLLTIRPPAGYAGDVSPESFSSLESQVQEFTLANGLKFIVVERHFAPVFSFVTMVDAGGVDSPLGKTGLAHMMEHMAFKGTPMVGTTDAKSEAAALDKVDEVWGRVLEQKKLAVFHRADSTRLAAAERDFAAAQDEARKYVVSNAFSKFLEENGAQELNAGTGVDQTVYYYSLPSNKLELWAVLEGGRMTYPVFREFYKEREVVIEERRIGAESSPRGRLREEMSLAAIAVHPYHNPNIGYRSDLESFSRADAERFFREHYTASNMVVVLVGDVKTAEVKRLAERYFSEIPGGPKPDPILTTEPPPRAERMVRTKEEAQPTCNVAYYGGPAFTDPNNLAVDALTDILGGGRSSRLYSHLVKEKRLATNVSCFSGYPGSKYPNLLWCSMTPAPGVSPDSLVAALQREFDDLNVHPVTTDDLQGYRSRARSDFVEGLHGNRGLAFQLANYQIRTGNWHDLFRYLDKIERLTPQEVTSEGLRIFTRGHRTIGIIENSGKTAGGKS